MQTQFSFDERLRSPDAVSNLAQPYPALFDRLKVWFRALADVDETALTNLINARGEEEVAKYREKGEAAVGDARLTAMSLGPVMMEVKKALAVEGSLPERAQLEGLLDAATKYRTALVEQAPALVAQALDSLPSVVAAKAAAASAADQTIARLEQLRERSADASKSYRELRGLIAELKKAHRALDRALEPLAERVRREIRDERQQRISAAASEMCRNLFLNKMRARADGSLPAPVIKEPGDSAADRLAAAIARRDFDEAESALAPWVREAWTASRIEEEFDRAAGEVAEGFELNVPPPAGSWQAGANPLSYQEIRDEEDTDAPVPADVTKDNFVGWHVIEILTEAEDEYLTDVGRLMTLYAISVRTGDGERIGYLRAVE